MIWPADAPPVIAILRGVRPSEVVEVAQALFDAGIRVIETPLNSPNPFDSIARLSKVFGGRCLCGAGTVLSIHDVDRVQAAGGKLIVTPNTDSEVIERAVALGLTVMPGFATATEAFTAIRAGARALKLFPAATYGPEHLKALKGVLPKDFPVFAVGGIGPEAMGAWRSAGAAGFGVGGELYRPGDKPTEVARRAHALMLSLAEAGYRAPQANKQPEQSAPAL